MTGSDQPDLSDQPDILRAHKLHLRLVRRLGRNAVATGYAFADYICRKWVEQRLYDDGFQARMDVFHGAGWQVHHADPTFAAAIYPQAVALTRLLASPRWQARGHHTNPAGRISGSGPAMGLLGAA